MSVFIEEAKIFLSAGEASGDLYASYLAKAVREQVPEAKIWGMGGYNMANSDVPLLVYSSHKGAIGVIEALKVIPFFLIAYAKVKKFLTHNPPNVLILVDFGAFNLRLGKWAKARGIPVLYFIPPGSWKREVGKNVHNLKKAADKIVCIFPWNQKALEKEGLEAYFFGHPLLDILEKEDKKRARLKLGLEEFPTLGLLPGSRKQELRYILPTILETVPILKRHLPSLQLVLAPPRDSLNFLKDCLPKDWKVSDDFLSWEEQKILIRAGHSWDVINASDALIIASGTATLEATILETPFIVVYKGSPLTHLEYHIRGLRFPYVSLPNIILGRKEFPELVQEQAVPALLATLALQLLRNEDRRKKQFQLFQEIKRNLGEKGMFKKTAVLVREMLWRSSKS